MSTAVQRRANLAVQNVCQQHRSAPCESRRAKRLPTVSFSAVRIPTRPGQVRGVMRKLGPGWRCWANFVSPPSFRSSLVVRRSSFVTRHSSGADEDVGTGGAAWRDDVMRNT